MASQNPSGAEYKTPKDQLKVAMSVADAIRMLESRGNKNSQQNSLQRTVATAGVQEGILAAAVCIGVCLPIRNFIIRRTQQQFGHVADLLMSPIMAIGSFQTSFWWGSLSGAETHLRRIDSLDAPSVRALCKQPILQDISVEVVPQLGFTE